MRLLVALLLVASPILAQTVTTPAGDVPSLRIQASVGTSRRAVEGSTYRKTMALRPKLIIEHATSRMQGVPALEATMVVVSMETRAKYVQRQNVYKVASAETLQIPAAAGGERREVNFQEKSLVYDADRDSTNVGGEVYKFFICGVRDPATRQLIYFNTSDAKLESICRANPAKREELLKMRAGATFPTDFN
jgi:hypothetical protein